MKKTEELRSKFDAIFDKNLTEVDNWNSAVFYSDKQKFINELLEAINYTRCSLQLKGKKTVTFEDWLYKHQIKKIDRLYFAKDGTEQDFNALHRRYVESLINL